MKKWYNRKYLHQKQRKLAFNYIAKLKYIQDNIRRDKVGGDYPDKRYHMEN